jgi:hypothetical protein
MENRARIASAAAVTAAAVASWIATPPTSVLWTSLGTLALSATGKPSSRGGDRGVGVAGDAVVDDRDAGEGEQLGDVGERQPARGRAGGPGGPRPDAGADRLLALGLEAELATERPLPPGAVAGRAAESEGGVLGEAVRRDRAAWARGQDLRRALGRQERGGDMTRCHGTPDARPDPAEVPACGRADANHYVTSGM